MKTEGTPPTFRAKFAGVNTPPLFPAPPAPPASDEAKPRRPAAVGRGSCPCCTGATVAAVRAGVHLVWGPHWITTWGGTSRSCRAAGVRLCHLAPLAPELGDARSLARCSCQGAK